MPFSKISALFPKNIKAILFFAVVNSWFTGVLFFILNRWFETETDFGFQKHPWVFPLLRFHGAAAFLMIFLYGVLLSTHVPKSWPTRRSRFFGIMLLSQQGLMILTGYLLYYLGDPTHKEITMYVHTTLGFTYPLVLLIHILTGKRNRPTNNRRR